MSEYDSPKVVMDANGGDVRPDVAVPAFVAVGVAIYNAAFNQNALVNANAVGNANVWINVNAPKK